MLTGQPWMMGKKWACFHYQVRKGKNSKKSKNKVKNPQAVEEIFWDHQTKTRIINQTID